MTIKRITKINHRIFQNFSWPSDLPTFERYNLIYGWNGSGKTTLSNLFRALEKKTNITDGTVEFEFEGGNKLSGSNIYGNQTIPKIKVFNREFVEDSVFSIQRPNMAPIFIIGEDSVEKQKQIDDHSATKAEIIRQLSIKETEFAAAMREEENFAIENGRHIKMAAGLAGYPPYSNYNQASFRAKAESLIQHGNVDDLMLSCDAYEVLRKVSVTDKKSTISMIASTFPPNVHLANEVETLLQTSIVANSLAELAGAPERERWVKQGLDLLGAEETVCMFCGQELSTHRIQRLEAHFNESYKNLLAELDIAKQTINKEIQSLDIHLPDASGFYDDLQDEFIKQKNELNEQKKQMLDQLQGLINLIDTKIASPLQLVPLSTTPEALTMMAINEINAIIKKHNDRTEDFNQQVAKARIRMEEHFVAQSLDTYIENKNVKNALETVCKEMQENVKDLNRKIRELEQDIVEHQKPAEELSADLAIYLGHKELEIRPLAEVPGYSVYRFGQPARNLSEGEKTAIALLYFLTSLKDKTFDLGDGIVVIDDPVSSLDANSLYGAFGYLKEKTVNAKQLFILTHHFTLFREAKNWIYYLKKKDHQKIAKYQIECERDANCRLSKICSLHKLLDEFDSEYYYLFDRVYSIGYHVASSATIDQYYGLPNIARRLVEAFFAFKRPALLKGESDKGLLEAIQSTQLDIAEKTKIYRFINTFSHLRRIGEQEHEMSILSETPMIMRSVLEMIKAEDPIHFAEMKQVIGVRV